MADSDRNDTRSEQQLRIDWQNRAKSIETIEEFAAFFDELKTYRHDYGSICVAIGALSVAAAWLLERQPTGGITRFQAGAVMWEMIGGWNCWPEGPKRVVFYADMCYPQYDQKFAQVISKDSWEWIQKRAAELLASTGEADSRVAAHWKSIIAGKVPFGYTVVDR